MLNEKKTILLVDDTETNIDILLELLGDEYDILVALDGPSALEIVAQESVDLMLLDIMMPQMDGYEVCTILKKNEKTKDIPIIFITAKTDEDSIEKAYEVGGIDYVTKPFKPRELLVRVKTQMKLQDVLQHLEFIASYDQMTGVYNRRKFFELAEKNYDENKNTTFAIMIDIDKFKDINDTYGHAVGDEVIKLVAHTINSMLDDESIFGRIGGEEFAIVCHSDSKDTIVQNVESIRVEIEKLKVTADDGSVIKFTISEGIAKATQETPNLDTILKEADLALYEAKGSGRNKVIFR